MCRLSILAIFIFRNNAWIRISFWYSLMLIQVRSEIYGCKNKPAVVVRTFTGPLLGSMNNKWNRIYIRLHTRVTAMECFSNPLREIERRLLLCACICCCCCVLFCQRIKKEVERKWEGSRPCCYSCFWLIILGCRSNLYRVWVRNGTVHYWL